MNTTKVTTNKWIAVAKTMGALCYGNPNEHLTYHLEDLGLDVLDCELVNGDRRREIMGHIKMWNKECRNNAFKCKPVKVTITIEGVKK
jgi:hypothetical protein